VLGVLEALSPGELEADDDASELGSADGSELGVELGVLLEPPDGSGLCEGLSSGGGGISQASAAFSAASVCSVTAAESPRSCALETRVTCAMYRLVRTMHSGESVCFAPVWESTFAVGALARAWLRLVIAEVGSSAASWPVPRLK